MNLEESFNNLKSERANKKETTGLITGTCMEYCPTYEQMERQMRNDINQFEVVLIKKYQRSAAGRTKSFPEDIRPVDVLYDVVNYLLSLLNPTKGSKYFKDSANENLFKNLYDKNSQPFLHDLYIFIENRIRAVRLDIAIQLLLCNKTIQMTEMIVRFYIIFNHLLYDYRNFEIHLNVDQLKKLLSDLLVMYDQRGYHNEEFCNYYVLINIDDFESCIKMIPLIELNIKSIFMAYAQNNAVSFNAILHNLDYLQICTVLPSIQKLVHKTIAVMKKSFVGKVPLSWLCNKFIIAEEETLHVLIKEGVDVKENLVDFNKKEYSKKEVYVPRFNISYCDGKSIKVIETLIKCGSIEKIFYNVIVFNYAKSILQNKNFNSKQTQDDELNNNVSKSITKNSEDTSINISPPKIINDIKNENTNFYFNDGKKKQNLPNIIPYSNTSTENNLKIQKKNEETSPYENQIFCPGGKIDDLSQTQNNEIIPTSYNAIYPLDRIIPYKSIYKILRNRLIKEYSKNLIFGAFKNKILLNYAKYKILKWLQIIKGMKEILFVTENTDFDKSILNIPSVDNKYILLENINTVDLSHFNLIIFQIEDNYLSQIIKHKHSMYNIIVGSSKEIDIKIKSSAFLDVLSKMKKIKSGMLLEKLKDMEPKQKFDFLWILAYNKRNNATIERNILNLKNHRKLVDCKIFYESESEN